MIKVIDTATGKKYRVVRADFNILPGERFINPEKGWVEKTIGDQGHQFIPTMWPKGPFIVVKEIIRKDVTFNLTDDEQDILTAKLEEIRSDRS